MHACTPSPPKSNPLNSQPRTRQLPLPADDALVVLRLALQNLLGALVPACDVGAVVSRVRMRLGG